MEMDYVEVSKANRGSGENVKLVEGYEFHSQGQHHGLHAKKQFNRLEEVVVGLSLKDNLEGCVGETNGECLKQFVGPCSGSRKVSVLPLQDCTNQLTSFTSAGTTRKWKKLAREVGPCVVSPSPMIVDRRPGLDNVESSAGKR